MSFAFPRQRRLAYLLTICLCWQLAVSAPSHASDLEDRIAEILESPDLDGILTGISVVDVERGEVILAKNADRLFAPASNVKLATTAAALHFIGPECTFRTSVYRNGEIKGNVLHGDLVVRGSGDPNISGRLYGGNIIRN